MTPTRSKRLAVMGVVSALCLAAVPATAVAGQYDYHLTSPLGVWVSRGVSHDYSYLRTDNGADFSMCLQRNTTGTKFCGGYFVSHSYVDSCNPSSCYTWYLNNTHSGSTYEDLSIHDEWR
jgi:hypothetical protein